MAATAAAAGDRVSPVLVMGSCLLGLLHQKLATSASAAGVCVASAGVTAAAVLAAGHPGGPACWTSVVLATCVGFHGGVWLLIHGFRRG